MAKSSGFWNSWRVHVNERAASKGQVALDICQDVKCPQEHYAYEPFKGRHPEPLGEWDLVLDSDGKVGK